MRRQYELDTQRQYRRLMLFITFVVVGIVVLLSVIYAQIILRRNTAFLDRVLKQYQQSISLEVQKTKEFVEAIVYNPAVVSYLAAEDAQARYAYAQQVSAFLAYMRAGRSEVLDIFFFRPDDPDVSFFALSDVQPEITQALLSHHRPEILGVYPFRLAAVRGATHLEASLLAGCSIYDTSYAGVRKRLVGAVAVAVDISAWTRELENLIALEGVSYHLMDGQGKPIAGELHCSDEVLKSQAFAAVHEGKETRLSRSGYVISVTVLPDMPGFLLSCMDSRLTLLDLWRALIWVVAVTVALVIVLLAASRWLKREVALPIDSLTRFIGRIGRDEGHARVEPTGNHDMKKLAETVNGMLDLQEQLTQDLVRSNTDLIASELATRRAELKFLRSQINPHFLYNTLEVVRSIAVVRKVPEIALMAKSLARILRFSIQGADMIPLEAELGIVEDYLEIQKLRFRDRIQVRVSVSEEARKVRVPRMCLQPTVENAFVHGLEQSIRPGELTIECWVEEDRLCVTVEDNGVGMSKEKADEINKNLQSPPPLDQGASGIGLMNVALRIRLMGQTQPGVWVSSTPEEGSRVTLTFPIVKEG